MIAQTTGFIGNDAEIKEANGRSYVRFSIADNVRVKGEDQTIWITCFTSMVGMAPHLKKGKQIFVSGELAISAHEGKPDVTMNVHAIKLLGKKNE